MLCKVTHCTGHVSANTRPHHLHMHTHTYTSSKPCVHSFTCSFLTFWSHNVRWTKMPVRGPGTWVNHTHVSSLSIFLSQISPSLPPLPHPHTHLQDCSPLVPYYCTPFLCIGRRAGGCWSKWGGKTACRPPESLPQFRPLPLLQGKMLNRSSSFFLGPFQAMAVDIGSSFSLLCYASIAGKTLLLCLVLCSASLTVHAHVSMCVWWWYWWYYCRANSSNWAMLWPSFNSGPLLKWDLVRKRKTELKILNLSGLTRNLVSKLAYHATTCSYASRYLLCLKLCQCNSPMLTWQEVYDLSGQPGDPSFNVVFK